jgi:hypothetical protein
LGDNGLAVVDVKLITATVSMVPHCPVINGRAAEDRFFVHEKIGLDMANMGGYNQPVLDEE